VHMPFSVDSLVKVHFTRLNILVSWLSNINLD